MKILCVPFGSQGDVDPLFWIADGLARKGHEPVFLLTPFYSFLAEERGFEWHPLGTEEEFASLLSNPLLWDRFRGPEVLMGEVAKLMERLGTATFEIAEGADLMVTGSLAVSARSVAEKLQIPSVTVHLQPVVFRSLENTPVFVPELAWLSRSPRWLRQFLYKLVDWRIWGEGKKSLNEFRRSCGLRPIDDFYAEAINGCDGVAALFPEWFAPKEVDWPPQLKLFGFPVETVERRPLPESLNRFLEDGKPPVLFTHGSANIHTDSFHRRAVAVCKELDQRCLLVGLKRPEIDLPNHVFHIDRARFEDLFPLCSVVVHHGGIGTLARALQAGVPQVIVPRSYDQPDNGIRIERLGVGKMVRYSQLNSVKFMETIRTVLEGRTFRENCDSVRVRIRNSQVRESLCTWMETFAK
ncbi:MAG: glycosyltransferase [Verrucomicrobiota bacterium]